MARPTRRTTIARLLLVVAVADVLVAHAGPTVKAQTQEPVIRIEQERGAAGAVTMVVVEHWPPGAMTASICGNEALRGSTDCDLEGSRDVIVPGSGTSAVPLPRLTPPIGCPCVVRTATAAEKFVRTAPIEIPGVATLTPEERPPRPEVVLPASQLKVSASLESRSTFSESVIAGLGGTAKRVLVVTLRSTAPAVMTNLSWTAVVGTSPHGTPVALPEIGILGPGTERTVEVPVDLPPATFGTFTATGHIKGLDAPVPFTAQSSHEPWGLLVAAVAVAVVLTAWVVRRRHRRRQSRSEPRTQSGDPGDREMAST